MKSRKNILFVGVLCLFVMLFTVSYIRAECSQCRSYTDDCAISCQDESGGQSKETTSTSSYYSCASEQTSKECTENRTGRQECATTQWYSEPDCPSGYETYTGTIYITYEADGDACD